MEYETFRHFSDSWGAVYLFAVLAIVVLYIFRPGSKKQYDDAGKIPLKRD